MITPNTKYRFTKGVVLSDKDFFVKGFEFLTGKNGELEEGKFNASFPVEVLEIWAEDGTIEDTNVFKPKDGQLVYYIANAPMSGASIGNFNFSSTSHKAYLDSGNVFPTNEDARQADALLKETLKKFYSIKGAR